MCGFVSRVCGRSKKVSCSWVLGIVALVPHRPTKENPPSPPEGRPKALLPFPSPHWSAPEHKGLAPCAWSSAFPPPRSLFFPAVRCRLPPVGCLEVGHLRFSSVGQVGSPLAPASGCAPSQGRAAQRPPEDLLHCAATTMRKRPRARPSQRGSGGWSRSWSLFSKALEQELCPLGGLGSGLGALTSFLCNRGQVLLSLVLRFLSIKKCT